LLGIFLELLLCHIGRKAFISKRIESQMETIEKAITFVSIGVCVAVGVAVGYFIARVL